jgi:large subunit ribosomal protein L22
MAETAKGYLSKAQLSNVHVSPRKARLVVDMIRGKSVARALEQLKFCDKKTAPLLKKLIMSAAANAKDKHSVGVEELYVSRAFVDAGRVLKRSLPRAQGRATPLRKRHSTITVHLDEL